VAGAGDGITRRIIEHPNGSSSRGEHVGERTICPMGVGPHGPPRASLAVVSPMSIVVAGIPPRWDQRESPPQ
jgi:hypothetical protein